MVTRSHARSINAFGAIADPTRRAILDALRAGERSAGDLADQFPVSRPAVSRHLRILRRAGLVRERRDMRSVNVSLANKLVREGLTMNKADTSGMRARLGPYYARWKTFFGPTVWSLLESNVGRVG